MNRGPCCTGPCRYCRHLFVSTSWALSHLMFPCPKCVMEPTVDSAIIWFNIINALNVYRIVCCNSVLQILLTLVLVVCLFHIFRQVVSTVYFFGNRGQTFDKMLIILSDDRKMKTGIKDMWIKIKCQCCRPSLKCSYKSWFMICQFLSPFMQWVVEGWPAVQCSRDRQLNFHGVAKYFCKLRSF